ncbi:MAG: heme-binding protein [bacterium]
MAIETPSYTVLESSGKIELRDYDGSITASVTIEADNYNYASSLAFRTLADYIFGNNTSQSKIAMTVPVSSSQAPTSEKIAMTAPVSASLIDSQSYIVTFTMPASYTLQTLPRPKNKAVSIKHVKPHRAVVIRFSGLTTEKKIDKMTQQLQDWAAQKNLKLIGAPTISRYDPPWKPGFIRRNEVSFQVR